MSILIIEPLVSLENVVDYENYLNKNKDSGFDLYCPDDIVVPAMSFSNKIGMCVKIEMKKNDENVGYMLVPRSSTGSKTCLRLSNSIGIIDKEYRGEIIACFDNFSKEDYIVKKGERLIQIVPFDGSGVEYANIGTVSNTIRGDNGFGSTGK